MPKLIYNKNLIFDAYTNRKKIGITTKQITEIFQINESTIYHYLKKDDDFLMSNTVNRKSFTDSLSVDIINYVLQSAINNQYFNVMTTCQEVNEKYNIELKRHHIYKILKINDITHKKAYHKQKLKYTDDELSNMISERIDKVSHANDVVFIDEVHVELESTNDYCWNKRGVESEIIDDIPPKIKNKRLTVIAAVSKNNKLMYRTYNKSVNGKIFKNYVNQLTKKTACKTYFLDNARIHHFHEVRKLLNNKHIDAIYGIAYRPFLNIIENFFRSFKCKIRGTLMINRTNCHQLIQKCWKSVSNDVITNTYNHVYVNTPVQNLIRDNG